MSESDPQAIDAALNKLEADEKSVAATATPADIPAIEEAAKAAGEMAADLDAMAPGPVTEEVPEVPEVPAVAAPALPPELQRLLAIEVPVIVQLGGRRLTVGEVMRFAVGAIIEISKAADDELDLLIKNKPVGKGHAVKVGENFGIKITRIGSVEEVIRKLGGKS